MGQRLIYTDSFTVTTDSTTIKKATSDEAVGGGSIPSTAGIRSLSILPTPTDGTFPDYWVKGTDPNSNWAKVPKEAPLFPLEGLDDTTTIFLYVKADSGSITLNLFVKGQ